MKCPQCQQDNPPHAKFCLECGTPFTPTHETGPRGQSYADLQDALTESLEQQTATAEILRVISSSPTDVQPVFDTILDNATHLCGAARGGLFLFDGDSFRAASMRGATPASLEYHTGRAIRPGPLSALARIIHERRPVHIHDLMDDPAYREGNPLRRAVVDLEGMRSLVMVPLLKGERLVSAIGVHRREVRPFDHAQIALLQTFADQAVIAIENVRLFQQLEVRNRDLTEALEQQTATSEILRVISSSPTDVQPVFDAIAQKALDLCQAKTSAVLRFDGELVHLVAGHSFSPEGIGSLRQSFPMPPSRGTGAARAVLSRATVYIPDVRQDPDYEARAVAQAVDYVSVLAVPMLHEGLPIGAIALSGAKAGAFSQRQIDLLQTFAAQAVIAIENVRLFQELEARNRELTESLQQQTATADVLKVISRSAFDLQTVLDTLCESVVRLCDADHALLFQREGEMFRYAASFGLATEVQNAQIRDYFKSRPVPVNRGSITR